MKEKPMAIDSIGQVVKINDEMADAMIEAFKKPYKEVEVSEKFIGTRADSKLIEKLKTKGV